MIRFFVFSTQICFATFALMIDSVYGQLEAERVDLWHSVVNHQIEDRLFIVRFSDWAHIEGNEDKTVRDFEVATQQTRPDATKAIEAAMKIAALNPTDDLGFLALDFALIQSSNTKDKVKTILPVIEVFEKHYLTDPRLKALLLYIARSASRDTNRETRDALVGLLAKIIEANPKGSEMRVVSAYYSAVERAGWVNDLELPEETRSKIRKELIALAEIARDEAGEIRFFGRPGKQRATELINSIEKLSVGGYLPNVKVHVVGGGEDELETYRGKIVLVDFWATWCVPCIASLPKVVKLKKEMESKPFVVITISIDDNDQLVEEFIADRMDLPFINWRTSPDSDLYTGWMIQGVPTYFLIDEDGKIHGRGNRFENLTQRAKELVEKVDKE